MSHGEVNGFDFADVLQEQVNAFFLRIPDETEEDFRKKRHPSLKVGPLIINMLFSVIRMSFGLRN